MKTITKFLTFILSLFCVFGLMSPVYAEGDNLELVQYKVTNTDKGGEDTNINDNYFLQIGSKYTFSWQLKGDPTHDLVQVATDYADKLKCDLFDVESGPVGSDPTDDENYILYATDAYITPVKEGKVTLEVANGKSVTFYVYNDVFEDVVKKIDNAFLSKCESLSITSTYDDPKPEMNRMMKEAISEAGVEEDAVDYYFEFGGADEKIYYNYGISVSSAGCDSEVGIEIKSVPNLTPEVKEDAPTTTIQSDTNKIVENTKATYSTEQQEVLSLGGSADVKVSVAKTTPSESDKKLVEAQLNSTNKIAMYLDLGVKVSIKDKDGNLVGDDVTVSETGTPVKFTVALDDSLINTKNTVDRTYQVVRVHNGVVDVLPATFDADNKTITFETDKFSTYAVMYTDTPKASKTPSTADGMNVALYASVTIISTLAVGMLFFIKKRNA